MAREVFKTKLTRLRQVTPTMKELVIDVDKAHNFAFKAGQFIMLQVPVPESQKLAQRAYSIASSDEHINHFKLLIKHVPGGLASEYVANMKEGDALDFTGPWGKCVFKTPVPEQVLFFCTGSGLAQHISFLLSDSPQFTQTKFRMLIGVGNDEEVFYREELEEAKRRVKDLELHWSISRPSDQWKGKKGRITQHIMDFDFKSISTHVYLCGRSEMIKDAKEILVEQNGFPRENLIIENFG